MANVYYAIESCFDDDGEYNQPVEISAAELTPDTHEALFRFLRCDLSALDKAMTDFLGTLNPATLEIDGKNIKKKRQKVYDALRNAHPYYRFGGSAVDETNRAAAYGLNILLYNNGRGGDALLPREKYLEILTGLSSDDAKFWGDEYKDELYRQYAEFRPADTDSEGGVPGYTFPAIRKAKDNLQKMLFWIFDFSVAELAHLTVYQRAHLYDNIFHGEFLPVLEIKKTYSFAPEDGRRSAVVLDFADEDDAIAVFQFHNNSGAYDAENNAAIPDIMKTLIDGVTKTTSTPVRELCEITELEQLLTLEVMGMIDQNLIVKRCRYCGNYFLAENMKNEYCQGYAQGEKKPCSEIGSARTYQNRVKNDEVKTLFQRAYKTHFARIKKGKMTQAEFNIWSIEAKQKMTDIREGRLGMDEYEAWLKV